MKNLSLVFFLQKPPPEESDRKAAFPGYHILPLQEIKCFKELKLLGQQIQSLKEVKLLGYIGSQSEMALFNFFTKYAVSLQKFVVDTSKYYKFYRSDQDLEDENNARTLAMKLLKPKIPSTVQFVCI